MGSDQFYEMFRGFNNGRQDCKSTQHAERLIAFLNSGGAVKYGRQTGKTKYKSEMMKIITLDARVKSNSDSTARMVYCDEALQEKEK